MALQIAKVELPKSAAVSKAAVKKLEALGPLGQTPPTWKPLWNGMVVPVADAGHVGIVTVDGARRAAFLGKKDKAARLVEGVPGGQYMDLDVTGEGDKAYFGLFPDGGTAWCVYALDVASGKVERVYEGPRRGLAPAVGGLMVAREESAVELLELDGKAGRVIATREIAPPAAGLGVCHGGRVVLAFRDGPTEAVALGVYPGEAEPLRVIGTIEHQWGGYAFRVVEERCLFQAVRKTHELTGFAEAYEAGRRGESVKSAPTAGELAFVYAPHKDLAAPESIRSIVQLNFERDDVVACAGDSLVTRLQYARKRSAIAMVDCATRGLRTLELPPGEYEALLVDESGTRARTYADPADALEIALPSLGLRHVGPAGDFGPDGCTVVFGTRVVRPGRDGAVDTEVARADITRPASFVTAVDGKVVAVHCQRKNGAPAIAVLGIYGSEMRLLAQLDPPAGSFYGWKRRGRRVFAWASDMWELEGLAEAYARGKDQPGLPLGDLSYAVEPTPTKPAPRPRATPNTDALVAQIRKAPKRPARTATQARLLAGPLPADVRRVIEALAEHQPKYVAFGLGFSMNDGTLDTRVPAPGDAVRDDLVVIGEDGGGNLYAFDTSDAGDVAHLLFVDHEADFADSGMSKSLEELLDESAKKAKEEDGEDEEDDGARGSGAGGRRRFTCTEGGSSKFWEAAIEGSSLTVRWGKIGTTGQTKTKAFAQVEAAKKEMEKLVEEKRGKGYVEE